MGQGTRTMRARLKGIVENTDTIGGQAFDVFVQVLIVISLAAFSVGTISNLHPSVRQWLNWVEAITVGLFTVEYGLRLFVAAKPWQYALSFWGIVDLAAILPFYLSTGLDLRVVRVLRLLRLFRLLKLARYNEALGLLSAAFKDAREELVLFVTASAFIVYLAAVGIYYFEREAQPEAFGSVFEGLWWAVATLTTVGYGDVFPVTAGGRIFTGLILMVGLGVVAVPAGIIASSLAKVRDEKTSQSGSRAESGGDSN